MHLLVLKEVTVQGQMSCKGLSEDKEKSLLKKALWFIQLFLEEKCSVVCRHSKNGSFLLV